jgi:hypothetical protein
LFFNWQIGITGISLSIFGIWIASVTAKEFKVSTVAQLAEKMTRENYLASRRNSKTYNKNEIEKIVHEWFSNDLYLNNLNRESRFN